MTTMPRWYADSTQYSNGKRSRFRLIDEHGKPVRLSRQKWAVLAAAAPELYEFLEQAADLIEFQHLRLKSEFGDVELRPEIIVRLQDLCRRISRSR